MKILKHGDLQPRKFTCTKCGCEFVADMTEYGKCSDIHPVYGPYTAYHIYCPECRHEINAENAPLYKEDEHRRFGDATGYWT